MRTWLHEMSPSLADFSPLISLARRIYGLSCGTRVQLESSDFVVMADGWAVPVCSDEEKALTACLDAEEDRLLAALQERPPTTPRFSAAALMASVLTDLAEALESGLLGVS